MTSTRSVDEELQALSRMTTGELCERYLRLFGQRHVRLRRDQHAELFEFVGVELVVVGATRARKPL